MSWVRIMLVVIAGVWTASCTQVHQLGQIDEGADDAAEADASTSASASTETSTSSGSTTEASSSESGTMDTSSDSSDDTSTETTSESGSETGGPVPEACDVVDLGGNEGVTLQIVLMSEWVAGACHEFHITNETADDVIWTRDLRFGGTLDNFWNAEGEELSATDWHFAGQASADNIVILAGGTIIFGGCMTCMPNP